VGKLTRAMEAAAEIEGNAPTVAALLGILKRHGFGTPGDPEAVSGSFDTGSLTLYPALTNAGWDVTGNENNFSAFDTEGRRWSSSTTTFLPTSTTDPSPRTTAPLLRSRGGFRCGNSPRT